MYRWVFEKFDGVRAIWSASTREMYSRFGTVLRIPNFFKDTLPSVWLDGEVQPSFPLFHTTFSELTLLALDRTRIGNKIPGDKLDNHCI